MNVRHWLSLLSMAVALSACADVAPPPSPSPSQVPDGPLMTLTLRGGLCPPGACETTIFVERDGRVHQAAKPPNEMGIVEPVALETLEQAIGAADFKEIRSHRFNGTCPTAYDGQEAVFVFYTATSIEPIASCEIAVDYSTPLFAAAAAALAPFVALGSGA